ncbi:hybrid sensor histidine kinase/response regulator [Orrella daihaiensis]|uniref:histidine kinase n=1 Tax=Orrella daihaiensis TaxID=2782176 RepID=A0ABY4AM00_9BURK|nr:ATP-binding protein [Orrella daihaiensis]UOD51297.1 response regulator [Orrella daihaiensis]
MSLSDLSLSKVMTPELLIVMDNLPFPISFAEVAETPMRVAFINKAFKRVFGYSLEEIADIDRWAELAYPDEAYRHEVMGSWNRDAEIAFKTQGTVPIREVEIRARDGSKVRTLLNGSFVGTSVVVAFIDISQQARAEAELRDVRQLLERTAFELTENLPVGTYTMVQPPEGGLGKFRFMSPRFVQLTGLTREELESDPLRAFTCIHPDDYDRWLELNKQAFENKAPFFGEAKILNKGVTRWIAAESAPRELEDGSTVWEGVLIDITDRKLAEESLAQAKARAEELERIKSDFLMRMSHEIRTPLTMILGLTDLLSDDRDRASQTMTIEQIRGAGNLLLGIVNDILDLSKIEAGQLITDELPFQVSDLIKHVQAFEASVGGRRLSLTVKHAPTDLPTLIGDQRRIEQVIGNLAGNAMKFTEAGSILVSFELTERTPDTVRLLISVTDTGKGIPDEQLPELFTPFMQGDTGIARQYGGTGLGLSISKELVELMGGQIGVQSTLGQGSTFWVELPLAVADATKPARARAQIADAHQASASAQPTASKPLAGLKVLVVDDSLSIRGLMRAFLQREGAEVELAENGELALEVLHVRGQAFDCVLMDVQMPVMDGLTATQRIRQIPALDHLPILAMTAGLLAEQQARARQAGMADVIAKPVQPARMVEQIMKAIGNTGPSDASAVSDNNPIPAIAGINRHHANLTMDGSLEMFDLLARVFVEEFEGFHDQLSHLLTSPQHPESIAMAKRLAHSLKGSAKQLGAFEVSDAAAALEVSLQSDRHNSPQKLNVLARLLVDLIKALKLYNST